MDLYGLKWYEEQEKKRKDRQEKSEVSLINRNLQNILRSVEKEIDKSQVKAQEGHINNLLISSNIWNMSYANNFENKKIALEQGIFIHLLLQMVNSDKRKRLEVEVDRFMRQLGNIDWSLYLEYAERKVEGKSI